MIKKKHYLSIFQWYDFGELSFADDGIIPADGFNGFHAEDVNAVAENQ